MSWYASKHMRLALYLVIYKFEASKKCQVSSVGKYIITLYETID